MMRLVSAYSVAVYTAEQCIFYDSFKAAELVALQAINQGSSTPDTLQLSAIHQTLSLESLAKRTPVLILVPDAWLVVSRSQIDHLIPSTLLPLAALSYAAETTFLPPEAVKFNYLQIALSDKRAELTVFACSNEWAELLCRPFYNTAKDCVIMPSSQWLDMKAPSRRSWSNCKKQALSSYQPNKVKNQKARMLLGYLLILSLFVQGGALTYLFSLHKHTEEAILVRQEVLELQSAWKAVHVENDFTQSILSVVQALPKSVRLAAVESDGAKAKVRMTLSQSDLDAVFIGWQHQFPHWLWEVSQTSNPAESVHKKVEVLDVSISIFSGY
jgi:hypothetical protein